MAFEFNHCCFCIELRAGCLVIGYVNLVCNIILLLLGIIGVFTGAVVAVAGKDDDTQAVGIGITIVMVIFLILVALFLAFTIALLVGVHKRKRGHVKAYLIYCLVFIVLGSLMFFIGVGSGSYDTETAVSRALHLLFNLYFWLVIRSFYLKMDDPSKRPAIYTTA